MTLDQFLFLNAPFQLADQGMFQNNQDEIARMKAENKYKQSTS